MDVQVCDELATDHGYLCLQATPAATPVATPAATPAAPTDAVASVSPAVKGANEKLSAIGESPFLGLMQPFLPWTVSQSLHATCL